MLLQSDKITKYYGVQKIFAELSFQIHKGEKIGLVGPNGQGKSTLLNCLTGQEPLESGRIVKRDDLNLGYLEQLPVWKEKRLVMEEMLASFTDLLAKKQQLAFLEEAMGKASPAELEKIMNKYSRLTEEYEKEGGYFFENKIKRVLSGLGFGREDFASDIRNFSGGQKTRLSLAKILVKEPDLLILDEPTNHLDLEAIEWLEDYLHDYKGALLVVSHDRYFLDKIVDKIWELHNGSLKAYNGNYSRYMKVKSELEAAYRKAYQKEQREIQETEEYIAKYRAGIKSRQARGRASILARRERMDKPEEMKALKSFAFSFRNDSGNIVLHFQDIVKAFAGKTVLPGIDFSIYKGQKVGLIGCNGSGKSTIMNIINGELPPDRGQVLFGSRVKTAYLSQEYKDLNEQNIVLDEIRQNFVLSETEARSLLGRFLFVGDDVLKKVGYLSGGERSRLAFLKIFLSEANFLLLDEPTNHLDIETKAVIEQALQEYSGTILVVSHDRYFLDQVVNTVFCLKEGHLTVSLGNYTEYKEYRERLAKEARLNRADKEVKKSRPVKKPAKSQGQARALEQEINDLEEELSRCRLQQTLPEVYSNGIKMKEIMEQIENLEMKITEKYELWEQLL